MSHSTIANHILEVFTGNNWTDVNIQDTIKDISFTEAIAITPASPNSIASILYHLKFYNKIMQQRLRGVVQKVNAANGFDMPALQSENDWKNLINETRQSFIDIAKATEIFPEERLAETGPDGQTSFYKNLHGLAEHAHYHLGQIVILKNLLRSKQ